MAKHVEFWRLQNASVRVWLCRPTDSLWSPCDPAQAALSRTRVECGSASFELQVDADDMQCLCCINVLTALIDTRCEIDPLSSPLPVLDKTELRNVLDTCGFRGHRNKAVARVGGLTEAKRSFVLCAAKALM